MSGAGSIPYHLRQNKAIERNLFVDLLGRIGRYVNISDYVYVGFGGPFLEDFKQIHSALRIGHMISIESDENVHNRQRFNQPISCIELRRMTSGRFIYDYDFECPTVVWFDYASPTQLNEQLTETQRLVAKLKHGDIFKITLNADPNTLGTPPGGGSPLAFRLVEAETRLGPYIPAGAVEQDVSRNHYPKLLLGALLNAAKHGLAASPGLYLQPLTAFSYADGQQMLTLTGMLLEHDEREPFLEQTRLNAWPFANLTGDEPKSISVPAFSVKERLLIESMLPEKNSDEIIDAMGYTIGDEQGKGSVLMKNFVEFYRLYPWYSKVVL